MKKLKLDIFKGTKAEIAVDKNNNKISILFDSYHYVEEITGNALPFDEFSQTDDNIVITTPSYKILDYTTLILRKVKNIDNKVDVVIVKNDLDEIYVIINRVFVHHNITESSNDWVYFKIHNIDNGYLTNIKFDYPSQQKDAIIGSRTINNGLIGLYDGNYVKYIQCSNDSDVDNAGRLLDHYYDTVSADKLIQEGDIAFLTSRNKSNKIYQPVTHFQTIDLLGFKNLSQFYDNIYYFDENENRWMYTCYENGSIHTKVLSDIL